MFQSDPPSAEVLQSPIDYVTEDFTVVWLDSNVNEKTNSIVTLQRAFKHVKTFDELTPCLNFQQNADNQKVFLILSHDFADIFVPLVHDIVKVLSIYILSDSKVNSEQLLKEWKKVKGIFDNMEFICTQVMRSIEQCENNFTPMSIISPSSIIDLNGLDPSFMYTKLLKEIFLEMGHDEKAKIEFIKFCHALNSAAQSSPLADFIRDFEDHSPIWWYTKESFIYVTLNRALRTQNVEILLKMGFFIEKLHKEIQQIHSKTMPTKRKTIYRGQAISISDLEKLKKSEGGLLSFNNFLSTSTSYRVASLFADSVRSDLDGIGIIFEIEIIPNNISIPFASLDNISIHSDHENEILFSMHTVFRIGELELIEDRLWFVNLTSTNDDDEQLHRLTEYIRTETKELTAKHRLGVMMIKMGEFDNAQLLFQTLLETESNDDWADQAHLHQQLGSVLQSKGDGLQALSNYYKTLQLIQINNISDYPLVATTYNHIGETH
ncbi:unnamed protein product [Rotaria magnacalcarata]|uniref:NAD(P)(+)--arginine ADP-ribosyltransferase n=1 Tax=Rotaria magnacalcarata TaxID=392030 RepID=A0A819H764_9BILA|nr:unnamed protein product [Rotaria magnacalcarata]CAF3892478.1 unnamed protein product [Rotaria magnacalcarata]